MTARGAVSRPRERKGAGAGARMTARAQEHKLWISPDPVILVTLVITAIGCDDQGDGNPEEHSQPPLGHLGLGFNS